MTGQDDSAVAALSLREALRICPHERRAMIFEVAWLLGVGVLSIPGVGDGLRWMGRGFGVLLQAVSPAVDFDLGGGRPPPDAFLRTLMYVAPLTFFFCYVVSGLLALRSGTLLPSAHFDGLAFFSDWWNLILYLVVVPLYVSCAVFLIYVTVLSWKRLNSFYAVEQADAPSFLSSTTRIVGFFAISLIIAGLFTSEYVSDLADKAVTSQLYWFFNDENGSRVPNRAGYYYIFLNATLLFLTAMAAFCFIALSIEIVKFGKHIPDVAAAAVRDKTMGADARQSFLRSMEHKIQETLDEYAYAYIIAKVLVAAYAVNIVVWQWSPAGHVTNVNSAIVALAIIGLIFLVVPGLYLNSRWHHVKYAFMRATGADGNVGIGEALRPRRFLKLETLLDGTFIFLLLKIAAEQFGESGIYEVIENIWS